MFRSPFRCSLPNHGPSTRSRYQHCPNDASRVNIETVSFVVVPEGHDHDGDDDPTRRYPHILASAFLRRRARDRGAPYLATDFDLIGLLEWLHETALPLPLLYSGLVEDDVRVIFGYAPGFDRHEIKDASELSLFLQDLSVDGCVASDGRGVAIVLFLVGRPPQPPVSSLLCV